MNYQAQSNLWKLSVLKNSKFAGENGTSKKIARFSQVFPFSFFPDEIIIEEKRIVWIKNNAFWSDEVISIMATDIASVNAAAGPAFGEIHIQSLTGGPEIRLDKLSRKDAYKIRGLVEGIALVSREHIQIENNNLEAERISLYRAGSIPLRY